MEELIQVSGAVAQGDGAASPGMTGGARAATFVSMAFFWGAVLWTGGSEILRPPGRLRLVGQEAIAAREADERRSFWDGSLARSVETDFRLGGSVRRKVVPYWSLAMLEIGDVISRDVILGKDNWLFLRDRVQLKPNETEHGRVVFPNFMGALSRSLAAHGTTLVTLPILRKGVACEEQLPDGLDPDVQLDREIIDNLKTRGVLTVDVFDKWRSMEPTDVYKRQDTHWEFQGRVELIKQLVRSVPGIPRDEVKAWNGFGDEGLNCGLLRYIGISPRHPAAKQAGATVEKSIRLLPKSFAEELEDQTYPSRILLVGTSFSAGFQFRELLAALLRAGVDDGSERGQRIFKTLQVELKKRFDSLPEFLLVEVPLYQVANTTRMSPHSNRAADVLFAELNGSLEYSYVPEGLLAPRDSTASLRGASIWSYAPGALISSGDGVLLLEVEFESDRASEWILSMGGARIPISVPAGFERRVLPLIEGPNVGDPIALLPVGSAAGSVEVQLNVVMDVSLENSRSVAGAAETGATWGFEGRLPIARFDALAIQWTEECAEPLTVSVIGLDAQGAPAEQRWAMHEPTLSRFGLFTIGAFADGEITEVHLSGVKGNVQVSIAPKISPQ